MQRSNYIEAVIIPQNKAIMNATLVGPHRVLSYSVLVLFDLLRGLLCYDRKFYTILYIILYHTIIHVTLYHKMVQT